MGWEFNMTNLTVAKTILEQLGGNRFVAMTGAKNFVAGESALSFKIGRNSTSINTVKVELTPMDTYTVTFSNVSKRKAGVVNKVISESTDVYCDTLVELFERTTGLYTKL